MNKLNQFGMSAIDFRKEFLNETYPELVHDSIGFTIDRTFEDFQNVIDKMKDLSCSESDFKNFLLTQEACCKTYDELLMEMEEIRASLALDAVDVEMECDVSKESISVKKEFLLHESFLRNYFYIETDNEFEKLMSRKGFVEKFAILRLKKIIVDFISSLDESHINLLKISNTPVFFNSDKNVYGVYLEMNIDVNMLEAESDKDNVREIANQILEAARTMFDDKMKI